MDSVLGARCTRPGSNPSGCFPKARALTDRGGKPRRRYQLFPGALRLVGRVCDHRQQISDRVPQPTRRHPGNHDLFWRPALLLAARQEEHCNGQICKFLPKEKAFENLTQAEHNEFIAKINNRSRKLLWCATPAKLFQNSATNRTQPPLLHFDPEFGKRLTRRVCR